MVVVQVITTRWTKRSRGAPASVVRAAVPEGVVLPETHLDGDVVVHEVAAVEADGFTFSQRRWEAVGLLPVTAAGLSLTRHGDAVEVERMADTRNGWPPRERPRIAFRLETGEWGRAVRNNRHSGWTGWSYSKVAVNVGNFDGQPQGDVFAAGSPAHLLDEQAKLL